MATVQLKDTRKERNSEGERTQPQSGVPDDYVGMIDGEDAREILIPFMGA